MDKYKDILDRLAKTDDPQMKRQLLDKIPQEDRAGELKRLEDWWNARYYYTDKKKTRIGDKFVWLYLTASTGGPDKKSVAQLRDVYNKTVLDEATKIIRKTDLQGFKEQLADAASVYVDSLKDPKPVFGLFTPKDKSETSRQERVGNIILKDHMDPLWRYLGDMEDVEIVASSFCFAAERAHPGMVYVLEDIIDSEDVEGDFKLWILDIFSRVKEENKKEEE